MHFNNIFIFICSFKLLHAIKLKIKEADPNGKYFIERGSLLTLTCESDSVSQSESVQWFLPSSPTFPVLTTDSTQPVSYKYEFIGIKRSVILTIRDVSTEYSGTYYCKSYQYEGNIQNLLYSVSVLVSLYKPVTPINCNNEQWIMLDSVGRIRCELYSEPAALVTWEFKGNQLSQSAKYKIVDWGLEINSVSPSDAGQYVLKARQIDYGSSFIRDIIVTTFELPKIVSGPTILGPVTDGVVEWWYSDIQCLATGNPPPTVHWFRKKSGNQELQIANPQKFFVNTNPKKGTLRITYPVYPDDNDEYTCQAMLATTFIDNVQFPKEVVSRSINISVSVRPQFTQVEQMNTIVNPGVNAFIRCRVRTTDPVKLQWQKYLGEVYTMGVQASDSRIKVSVEKEPLDPLYQVLRLDINNVQFKDSWNYTCIATNPGSNYSYNGTIVVRQKPILSNNTLKQEFGWLYNATNLTCISYGLPHPTRWFWYRFRYSVLNDINSTFRIISYDFETHSQSWLQIIPDLSSQYWIFDLYECQAQNEVGEARQYVRFSSAQVPASPIATLINSSSSDITIKLEPSIRDGGMKLLHYEMVYRAMQGPTTMYGPVIFQPDQTTVVMDGLVHGTTYQVSFYSCNAVGRSPEYTISGQTKSATVPFPVKVISKRKSGYPYGYNLEWKVPLNGGFPLLGYRIFIQSVTVPNNYAGNSSRNFLVEHTELLSNAGLMRIFEPMLTNPYESVFRLDDLEAETIYKIFIEAKNSIGYSNRTVFYFFTPIGDTLGKPPRVRGFQNNLQPTLYLYPVIIIMIYFYTYFY